MKVFVQFNIYTAPIEIYSLMYLKSVDYLYFLVYMVEKYGTMKDLISIKEVIYKVKQFIKLLVCFPGLLKCIKIMKEIWHKINKRFC
jgi:hypothetical protein